MGRRGNPYDNAMVESFMKTLKVEGVYPMAFESEEEVARHLPRCIDSYNERRLDALNAKGNLRLRCCGCRVSTGLDRRLAIPRLGLNGEW